MIDLNLPSADWAIRTLKNLYGGFSKSSIGSLLGREPWLVDKWIGTAVREGFIKITSKGFITEYRVTEPGHVILANLTHLAEEFPGEWAKRYRALDGVVSEVAPQGVLASSLTRNQLSDEWERAEQADVATNIRSIRDNEEDFG